MSSIGLFNHIIWVNYVLGLKKLSTIRTSVHAFDGQVHRKFRDGSIYLRILIPYYALVLVIKICRPKRGYWKQIKVLHMIDTKNKGP